MQDIIDFLNYIKTKINSNINYYNFSTEILTHKSYFINIIDCNNIFMLYGDKIAQQLHHTNNCINNIIHNYEFIVLSKLDFSILCYLKKPKYINNLNNIDITKYLNNIDNIDIAKYKIYKNHIGEYSIIIKYLNNFYSCKKYKIKCINSDDNISVGDYIIYDKDISKILLYEEHNISELINHKITKLPSDLIDVKNIDLSKINNDIIKHKKITTGGYVLIDQNNNRLILEPEIYTYIKNKIPKYNNFHKCCFDLYINNNLNELISYLTLYCFQTITRINLSLKILSREILNIYHMTRRHENEKLYNILSKNYKKILYELHKIFINKRSEYNLNFTNTQHKKSITIDDVYNYIISMCLIDIFTLYNDREKFINNYNIDLDINKIIIQEDDDLKIQIELMKN